MTDTETFNLPFTEGKQNVYDISIEIPERYQETEDASDSLDVRMIVCDNNNSFHMFPMHCEGDGVYSCAVPGSISPKNFMIECIYSGMYCKICEGDFTIKRPVTPNITAVSHGEREDRSQYANNDMAKMAQGSMHNMGQGSYSLGEVKNNKVEDPVATQQLEEENRKELLAKQLIKEIRQTPISSKKSEVKSMVDLLKKLAGSE